MTERPSAMPTGESVVDATARILAIKDDTALVVVMAIVPDLYSRNRMFNLMSDPRLRRARRRAIALRTAVRQIVSGGTSRVELEPCTAGTRLTYVVPRVAYTRRLELSELERATVAFLVERAGSTALTCSPEDRTQVERTLASLIEVEEAPPIASGER